MGFAAHSTRRMRAWGARCQVCQGDGTGRRMDSSEAGDMRCRAEPKRWRKYRSRFGNDNTHRHSPHSLEFQPLETPRAQRTRNRR